ncbi:MAG: ferric reductase-like transmembrane domain-containing protein [Sandaracinaceae bacterium]|nr:ferric reductase-like transmembrane domain-containing protein [Sandaracinaceae bacterium]
MSLAASIARNKRKAAILTLYALATVLLLTWRFQHYAHAPSVLVPIARASAAGIYFNFALVLLPLLRFLFSRRSLSFLRAVFPLHQALEAHAIAGVAVLGFSVVHTLAYIGLTFTHPALVASFGGVALATGVLLVLLLGALAWGAWQRTRGRYDAFYYTHFLTIPIAIAATFHAPWFVQVASVPLLLFLADRFVRLRFMAEPAIVESIHEDGRDIDLVLRRPLNFTYQAGDYAFLCVPSLSRLEWHPFSLINATSDTGSLAFRIRKSGNWTQSLAKLSVGTPVYVDGPLASPCREMHDCKRMVLVAAGIGITPFVSFLEEVRSSGVCPFERMQVYWLERDEASFGRFMPLLEELEGTLGGRLSVELIIRPLAPDGANGEAAPRTAPVGKLVSVRAVDWDQELVRVREQDLEGATLFFCGPPSLSKLLARSTRVAGLHFRTESF